MLKKSSAYLIDVCIITVLYVQLLVFWTVTVGSRGHHPFLDHTSAVYAKVPKRTHAVMRL